MGHAAGKDFIPAASEEIHGSEGIYYRINRRTGEAYLYVHGESHPVPRDNETLVDEMRR